MSSGPTPDTLLAAIESESGRRPCPVRDGVVDEREPGASAAQPYEQGPQQQRDDGHVVNAASDDQRLAASDRVRSDVANEGILIDRFDSDTGTTIPGVLSIVDIVDRGRPELTRPEVVALADAVGQVEGRLPRTGGGSPRSRAWRGSRASSRKRARCSPAATPASWRAT